MKEHIRKRFDEEQPVIDVLRQVHGLPPGSGEPKKTQELTQEQAQAFDLLFVMTPSSFEAERKWRAAAVNAVVRVNPGARRRLRALKSNNSKHTRPIGFTPMMNPLTKKIQRTYVSTDQCLFCPKVSLVPSFHMFRTVLPREASASFNRSRKFLAKIWLGR
jgi:hypothetical protein